LSIGNSALNVYVHILIATGLLPILLIAMVKYSQILDKIYLARCAVAYATDALTWIGIAMDNLSYLQGIELVW
jgi:hypothetical protein